MTVPEWNGAGLLPPYDADRPVSRQRSPYVVTVADVIAKLCTTPQRCAIADGFLRYRADLHALGFTSGFQWVDGSFCTDVETLEGRAPGDIDIVTFLDMPPDLDQEAAFVAKPDLFLQPKEVYSCDAYFVELNGTTPEYLVANSAYWSSVWGHTRSGTWKGFLQVSLDPEFDGLARDMLQAVEVAQ
jgi:hypothetical protein